MAREPHELSSEEAGGQVHYPILPAFGLTDDLRRLLHGEVDFIDVKLRTPNSLETHDARVTIERSSLHRSPNFDDTWIFGHGEYQEVDADGREIGARRSCNGFFTLRNVPTPGEIRVSDAT